MTRNVADWTVGATGVVFDTCILIDAWHAAKKQSPLWANIEGVEPGRRWLSSVSLHELLQGDFKLDLRKAQHRWALERFQVLQLDGPTDRVLRSYHEIEIPEPKTLGDWLLAAAAQARGFAIATNDAKRSAFRTLEPLGLKVIVPPVA